MRHLVHPTAAIVLVVALVATACSTAVADPEPIEPQATTTQPAVVDQVVASSTTTAATTTTEAAPTTTTTTRPPIDDPYIEVNGVRLVYRCAGDAKTTVLVDQGLGGNGLEPLTENFMGWQSIVDEVQDRVRICVYNRRGIGKSDNKRQSAALRTTQDQVDDLVGVIEALDLGPVIIVGHSIAGFNLRLLADQHPDLVAGAIFVDASHPEQVTQLGSIPAFAPEYLDVGTSSLQIMGKGDMGDKPVFVITGLANQGTEEETAIWLSLHEDHATLSTTSKHVILTDVGHWVHASSPQTVIEAIDWVVAQLEDQ